MSLSQKVHWIGKNTCLLSDGMILHQNYIFPLECAQWRKIQIIFTSDIWSLKKHLCTVPQVHSLVFHHHYQHSSEKLVQSCHPRVGSSLLSCCCSRPPALPVVACGPVGRLFIHFPAHRLVLIGDATTSRATFLMPCAALDASTSL